MGNKTVSVLFEYGREQFDRLKEAPKESKLQAQRQKEQAEKERRAKGKASHQGLALQLHYKRLMEDEANVRTDLLLHFPRSE